jgi:ribose transport system permease protein
MRMGKSFWNLLTGPAGRALVALALMLVLGAVFNAQGAFFRIGTHRDALNYIAMYGVLACGMTLVIISGGIDLSVGSVVGLVAVLFSLMSIPWGWSPWLAIPASLAVGAACGAVCGGLIARLGIQPFIATLAMMVYARGLAKWTTGNTKIQTATPPPIFDAIDSHLFHGSLSTITVIFLACAALTGLVLARHRWGRELYAIGGNEEAARLSGVRVGWSKTLAYVASGLFSAVAGICYAAQAKQGDPEAGGGFELTAIAIVVIGGTSLMGGRGGMVLTLIGTLTIGYLIKILSINSVADPVRLMLTGAIIIAAVLAQKRRRA